MSSRGRELAPETVEFVVRLKQHFDRERKTKRVVSTRNPAERAAEAAGVSEATVKRIMARFHRDGESAVPTVQKPRGRPAHSVSPNLQPVVRAFIRTKNLEGKRVSAGRVRSFLGDEHGIEIPKATLWRTLTRWGFVHGEGRRRSALKEQAHVIRARREYLRVKLDNRNSDGSLKRPEVYLDETYINRNHSSRFTWYLGEDGPWVNKPSGVGPRLIVVHAITLGGWVDGAELVFLAKKRTGDYHGQMNWENFSKWFTIQLMPNIPANSLIILDNAKYHNVLVQQSFPNKGTGKEKLRKWLERNHIPWREDMLKTELFELCHRFAPVPEYRLDEIVAKHGHTVLRTPPYHPELQPIETCWAIIKNHMADNCSFTMRNLHAELPNAFSKVTAEVCQGILEKVGKQEDRFWADDEKLDEVYARDDLEAHVAESTGGNTAEDPFLEES